MHTNPHTKKLNHFKDFVEDAVRDFSGAVHENRPNISRKIEIKINVVSLIDGF